MTLTPPHDAAPGDARATAIGHLASTIAEWRTDNRVMEELLARRVHEDLDAGGLDLLTWIVNKAPVSAEQLAEMLLLPVRAVQEWVDELERLDLVRVAEPDADGVRFLTPRPYATKISRRMTVSTVSALGAAVESWPQEDVEQLDALLRRLMSGYDAIDVGDVAELLLADGGSHSYAAPAPTLDEDVIG